MSAKIISLSASNVKRLKAVEITPTGAVVVVGGRNGQGKTSLLDCIAMALGGKDEVQEQPIRRGQTAAKIVLETDELKVTRKFTVAGSTLEVTNKEGMKYPSPQAVLDKLTTSLAFDPLAFTRAKPADQLLQLRALVGIDTTEIDAERKMAFDTRTLRNREVKSQRGVVEALPETGPPRVDVQALLNELDAANAHNQTKVNLVRSVEGAQAEAKRMRGNIARQQQEILDLKEQIARIDGQLEQDAKYLTDCEQATMKAESDLSCFAEKPVDDIRQQLSQAETTNRAADRVEQRKAEQTKLDKLDKAAADLTSQIEALDKKRTALLDSAKFPVPGLGFVEGGVTFNEIPLQQASSAEQLRVGLAVACAMNPKLKVMLIRDGSLLDADSMALVAELAEAQGAQVWIERVGDDGTCTVVIEDGEVQAPAETAPAESGELALK